MTETEKTCPNCGTVFKTRHYSKKFCCAQCCRDWYHKHGNPHKEAREGDTVLREFRCKNCGKTVLVVEAKDRRTQFCTQACEKDYGRRTYKRNRRESNNRGLAVFTSFGAFTRNERRSLD